jgi:hypothetical protein
MESRSVTSSASRLNFFRPVLPVVYARATIRSGGFRPVPELTGYRLLLDDLAAAAV